MRHYGGLTVVVSCVQSEWEEDWGYEVGKWAPTCPCALTSSTLLVASAIL